MEPADISRHKRAVRDLESNIVWQQIIAPQIAKAEESMLQGLADRTKGAEQRETFLEGYHLALNLKVMLQKHKDLLEAEEKKLAEKGEVADDDDP